MCTNDPSCRSKIESAREFLALLPILVFCFLAMSAGRPALAQDVDGGPLGASAIDVACDPARVDPCPGDGNLCTANVCNPTTRKCEYPAIVCQDDGNLCTTETCNPSTGQCSTAPPIDCPGDGNACTTDSCNPSTGHCESSAPKSCAVDNACQTGSCNPSSGACEYQPVTCPSDGSACTTESCNVTTGRCESSAPKTCTSIDNLCAVGSCNPSSGQCEFAAVTCSQDSDLCSTESCNPATGHCESGAPKSCAVDNACSTGSCNPATGQCVTQPVTCQQDDNACTAESCNPATGRCESGAPKSCPGDNRCSTGSCDPATGGCKQTPVICDPDSDNCTTEVCDVATGNCHSVAANPLPDNCGVSICRTPGFWGTHAGTEKAGSANITQAVITAGGGILSICGQGITNTVLSDDDSAVEAICVNVKDTILLQLARQLTSASLNCIVSDGVPDCSSTPLYSALFARCNTTCATAGSTKADITNCVNDLDCLNNGGKKLANGFCQTGTCADGTTACSATRACVDASACKPIDGNCHDQLLVNRGLGFNFEPSGAAGSSTECNDAIKNTCKVIGSAQANCKF